MIFMEWRLMNGYGNGQRGFTISDNMSKARAFILQPIQQSSINLLASSWKLMKNLWKTNENTFSALHQRTERAKDENEEN